MYAVTPLSNLIEITPRVKLNKGHEYPFVDMGAIEPSQRYVKASQYRKYTGGGSKFCSGDTLFARITPCLENGKIAQYVSPSSVGFGSTELFVFRARAGISDAGFIHYLSKSDIIRKPAEKSMSGASGRQRANVQSIVDLPVPAPPLRIQRKIVAVLSAYDDLIENNLKRIKILEEMAQNLYREWFVKFRFPGHETARFVDSQLGMIPEEWEVIKLGDVFPVVLGGTPSRRKAEFWRNGVIPWINSGKVNELRVTEPSELITVEALKNSSAKVMPRRTTLIAITGATLGQVSLLEIEASANQSVVGVYDEREIYNEWLYQSIQNRISRIINHASGGAQQHINKGIVEDVILAMPPHKLAIEYHRLIDPIYALVASLIFRSTSLRRSRDLLLPKLISGEIDVSELDIAIPKEYA